MKTLKLEFREFFKIGFIYSLVKYSIMGIGVVKSFYIADFLGATLLGSYAVVMLIVEYLNYSNLGVFAAMNRDVAIFLEDNSKKNRVKDLLDVSLSFALFPILILGFIFFGLNHLNIYFLPEEFYKYSLMILALVAVYQYKIFLLRYLRLYGRYYVVASLEFSAQSISLIGIILFIEIYSIDAVLWSVLVSNIFFILCGFIFVRDYSFKIDFHLIKYMISVGSPMLLYSVILFVLSSADRIVITDSFENRSSLGLYQFGSIASQGLFIAFNSVTFLFYPRWIKFLQKKDEEDDPYQSIKGQTEIFEFLLGFLTVSGIIFITPFINYFLPQYEVSILIAQLLMIANMFNGMTFINSTFLISNNYQMKLVPIIFITVAVAFMLNYSFIWLGYGLFGIAFSTILSFTLYSFSVCYLSLKYSDSLNLKNFFISFYRLILFAPFAIFILYENYNNLLILLCYVLIYFSSFYVLIKKLISKKNENQSF